MHSDPLPTLQDLAEISHWSSTRGGVFTAIVLDLNRGPTIMQAGTGIMFFSCRNNFTALANFGEIVESLCMSLTVFNFYSACEEANESWSVS